MTSASQGRLNSPKIRNNIAANFRIGCVIVHREVDNGAWIETVIDHAVMCLISVFPSRFKGEINQVTCIVLPNGEHSHVASKNSMEFTIFEFFIQLAAGRFIKIPTYDPITRSDQRMRKRLRDRETSITRMRRAIWVTCGYQ